MMNVSGWSIKNPIAAAMTFVMLTLAGLLSFGAMKVQNFPDLELPTITIVATLNGAAPAQLEAEVGRKIENAIANVQGLKHTYTKIQDGGVTITAEFRLEKPTQEALDEVRQAVAQIRADLPPDMREPVVSKLNLAGLPILTFTIKAEGMDEEALSWFVDQTVTKTLVGVKGVGAVTRVGGVARQMQVTLDVAAMQSLKVSAVQVNQALKEVQQDSSAGRGDIAAQERSLRALGQVYDAQALANLNITLQGVGNGGQSIKLGQIAKITDTVAEPRSAALLDGKPVVGFEVSRSRGASEVEVGAGVEKALAELTAKHPNITLAKAFDFVEPVQSEYHASMKLLYEGAFLAVLVVWLFLRDWRATLVSAVALPLSVIPAFIGMHYLGFSTNVVTLLALSLVVGILVDDAIVEVENIVRHLRMGKTPYQAAMEAADEIGLAVIATTFTLVAVFLPTAFMSGIAGKFFKQFGWTAALAVMASLLVARMLTPMMAAYILKPIVSHQEKPSSMGDWYMRTVAWCLKHRLVTVLASIAFFIGSVMLIPLLPQGFIPPDDMSQSQVVIESPPGTPLSETLKLAELARERVAKVKHIQSIYTTIGAGSAGADPFAPAGLQETRRATLTLTLSPRTDRSGIKKQAIERDLRAAIADLPGVRTRVGLGASGEKYILVLTSDDPLALSQAATAVEKDLRGLPDIGSVNSTAALVKPEVSLSIDPALAALHGVNTGSIAQTLRVATLGEFDAALPKLNTSERQIPILVKVDTASREDLSALARLYVPSTKPGAAPVMLGNVASLSLTAGPAEINRYDRSRNVNFEIELSGVPLGVVKNAVDNLPSIKALPPSVRQIEIGDAEVQDELFASFALAMMIGVLCIYIVLVLLFKGFLQPITILFALPLSLGGAFVGLLLANQSFSMPSLIGLIMLMGIATKNSILLVEYAIVAEKERGMSRRDALIDACHKRARPIIMTTLAMGAGMLPVAIGWGSADPSFRSPMAVSVIGGLVTSTFLSLLVIPVVYDLIEGFKRRTKTLLLGK